MAARTAIAVDRRSAMGGARGVPESLAVHIRDHVDRFSALLGARRGPVNPGLALREENIEALRAFVANPAAVTVPDSHRAVYGSLHWNLAAGVWQARYDASAPTPAEVSCPPVPRPVPGARTLAPGLVVQSHTRWLLDLAVREPSLLCLCAGTGLPMLDSGLRLASATGNTLRNVAIHLVPPPTFRGAGGVFTRDLEPDGPDPAGERRWRAWQPSTPGCWAAPVSVRPEGPAVAYRPAGAMM